MLGIVWVYARKGSHLPSLKNKIFQGCLMVTFSAMLTNILSTVMIYEYQRIPLWMTWTVTMVYFILTPLMGLAYFLYTASVIYTESADIRKVIAIGSIPGAVYTLLVLVNPFNRVLFDINSREGYTRGSLISVTYIIFYAYCVASIVITVWNHKRIDKNIYKILAAFPILAVSVIIVQQMYPNVILSGSAATCALLIIYLHLQNKQISLDYLTNVPNRQELLNMLKLMLKRAPQKEFVLLVVSLREFRQINNTCGQQKGDEFLKQVCAFLCEAGPEGNVYRYSGDEFALLFPKKDEAQIIKCVKAIERRMEEPWQVGDYCFILSTVMGIIYHDGTEQTLEKTVNAVEYAVFQAKSGKYGQVCYCDKKMLEKLERRNKVIAILHEQVAEKSFEMYYQPIYCLETGTFDYAESLMRIPHSEIGPIYPDEFIPIAEETGLIIDITYIILDKVCKFINRLTQKGIKIGAVHVNFSALQFSQLNLEAKVLEIIENNHTPMSALKIEFTESTLAESTQAVTEFALDMLDHGIRIGLDDFGTGYSNIATVISIPFGTVKLDKSLVWGAMDNKKSALAVKNLTKTFKELGMQVVAEGVETEEQKKLVADFGVDQIQGYYYARPMPEAEMEEFMLRNGRGAADQKG
ncbi:MAG: bifunctional diguanylate cyclase/phosphodiesterase [Eubacteriales bacterium]|nr:bifunctional diguanylate cyclase/phosphodiesterase [Eubacteriales bacterium]